ncbi:MAG: ribulose-phosphate 3-epimerase [Bacteroidales bacterium]|jgi:ribulose-phosphate 3-epimerase|nr:ribulose-phosphate 3-epimerase [Bacteroidales bacterium]MBP8677337.1 ribulose-phosphate 3-epimerase [Bacteroidales bacterium]MBP9584402.1 ribulose-phosphate 3-epimerase [Bacteroidales bacterium]MBP9979201.1 ribulose-phosphate 3-epimerase [Bacteroidales bacterium]
MATLIAPSMLSANFGNLASDIEMVNNSEADLFHLDIMDGLFVPNISYGFPVVKAISELAKKPMDAHLMIVDPDRYIERFAKEGVKYLSVHIEACTHLHRTIQNIKECGMKAGVALNPHTPAYMIKEIIADTDFVLVMSVNPGFGGQSFIASSLNKIREIRDMASKAAPNLLIEVDGGVSKENAPLLVEAGADILVAGNSIFSKSSPSEAIKELKQLTR